MDFAWEDSRRAFADAADWFVRTAGLVGDRWDEPGLGEWDLRALVGHTSRSLLTVETYLGRPAGAVEVASAADYFRATRAAARGPGVAERGREAGAALGADTGGCGGRDRRSGTAARGRPGRDRAGDHDRRWNAAAATTCRPGRSSWPCTRRTSPPRCTSPSTYRRPQPSRPWHSVSALAVTGGLAGRLLLTATGRPGPAAGFTVL